MPRLRTLLVALVVSAALVSCSQQPTNYYLHDVSNTSEDLIRLFELLDEETEQDRRVPLVEQIAGRLGSAVPDARVVNFLTDQVSEEDPHSGYYLLLAGRVYEESGAPHTAAVYYRRALEDYPDISIRGSSVHYRAIGRLLDLSEAPEHRAAYLAELLDRFPDQIDPGSTYYRLGQALEASGRWEEAFAAYTSMLRYPDTVIIGDPNAYQITRQRVAFYNSDKSWTREDLDALIRDITYAIRTRNPRLLESLHAEVNFFGRSWEQDEFDVNATFQIPIGQYLLRDRIIRYAGDVHPRSNNREAYLWTANWAFRPNVWYLYFRRIHFPADPEIHGRWEWAGILFGDLL